MSKPDTKHPPPPAAAAERRQFRSLDDAIEHFVGELGWRQFVQSVILSLAWFFDSQQAFITIFTDAEPKWHCNDNATCNNTNTLCGLPAGSWSWDWPAGTSILSEWSLQCASPIVRGLPASSFLAGCIIGGSLLATIADSSIGRKNLLVICCLIMSVPGILISLSTNIWTYSALRFVSGIGRAIIGSCALVLSNEIIGKKWRDRIGIIGFLCFTLGFLSLPIIAFSLQGHSWRLMYLVTCIPCMIYASIVYFSVHESPRWLFVRGRKEEFVRTLKRITGNDGLSFDDGDYDAWTGEISREKGVFSALKLLVNKKWAVRRLVATLAVHFGIGMAYFGMPLGVGNLPFNLYLSAGFNAVVEIPSAAVTFCLIGRMDRKAAVLGFCVASGVCGLGSVVVPWKGLVMGLELVGFFGVCTACDVLLIYTLELFPTCVRNSTLSVARQAGALGGAVSPMLVAAGRECRWVSYGVFGAGILASGVVVVWLPETRRNALADTMEEEERRIDGYEYRDEKALP